MDLLHEVDMSFYGRKEELALLNQFAEKKIASLIVMRGRRRIGKSRLIEEFAQSKNFIRISGVAPSAATTALQQREEFASQLSTYGVPKPNSEDWNNVLWALAEKTRSGKYIILLDEISWVGSKDPNFLGKLKNLWDTHFKVNPNLMLILCGSASSWIAQNILSNTGFVGRISQTITLKELPLNTCNYFWRKQSQKVSAMEKLKVLSVTGGVPRYLEEVNPAISAESNINNMCFTEGAILENEFDHIFTSMFLRDSESYKKILKILVSGHKTYTEIAEEINLASTGRVLEYLEELELAGFITRDYTWQLKTGKDSKLSQFRLSDCYIRFYLKYIEPNKSKIKRRTFEMKSLSNLTNWETIMGLQFENLVLNNRMYIWENLGLAVDEIISENPYFQRKTQEQAGCQIDYLIQLKFNTIYICEVKFSKNPIGLGIIKELEKKYEALAKGKSFSCRPVLIHVNGVEDSVVESEYFSNIINFSDILMANF